MKQREKLEDQQVLALLKEISQIARSAKKVQEIVEAMDYIAHQTTLMALEANIFNKMDSSSNGLSKIGHSVADASEDMYLQFEQLVQEVSDLHSILKGKNIQPVQQKNFN